MNQLKKCILAIAFVSLTVFALPIYTQASSSTWNMRDISIFIDGEESTLVATGQTSRASFSVAAIVSGLGLPADSFEWHQNNIRLHELAEQLQLHIVYDMYERRIDITTGESEAFSQVLPVQYIPRYGWVRMTDEMLRDIERMLGEAALRPVHALGLTEIVFDPYLSAAQRRWGYEQRANPESTLFTHTHRASTGSNYLARNFFANIYRPGLGNPSGSGSGGIPTDLQLNLFERAERGEGAPNLERHFAARISQQNNPNIGRLPTFVGIGRYFCERTGDFIAGGFQAGAYAPERPLYQGGNPVRLYLIMENGYFVVYRDFHGERVELARDALSSTNFGVRMPGRIITQDGTVIYTVSGQSVTLSSPPVRVYTERTIGWASGSGRGLYLTGCPYLHGFQTMEPMMLPSAFNGN